LETTHATLVLGDRITLPWSLEATTPPRSSLEGGLSGSPVVRAASRRQRYVATRRQWCRPVPRHTSQGGCTAATCLGGCTSTLPPLGPHHGTRCPYGTWRPWRMRLAAHDVLRAAPRRYTPLGGLSQATVHDVGISPLHTCVLRTAHLLFFMQHTCCSSCCTLVILLAAHLLYFVP